jgi:hypothetical protein
MLPEGAEPFVAAHDRGALIVCAGGDFGVRALASTVAPDEPNRSRRTTRARSPADPFVG